MRKTKPTDFSMALADYFFVFLPTQKGLSENTICSYSDSFADTCGEIRLFQYFCNSFR